MKSHSSTRPTGLTTLLTVAALVALPFSYYPLVNLGTIAGMHIDGSLLYLLVGLAVCGAVPYLWNNRLTVQAAPRPFLWLGAFILFCVVSILWSANPTRGTFTTLFVLLLSGLAYIVALQLPELMRRRTLILRLMGASISVAALWAIWQIYGEAFGVSSSWTLLSGNYQSGAFGVARPTGFALEPQFFASFLLLPFFFLSWRLLRPTDTRTRTILFISLVAIGTVLLLTLSRGAVYAAAAGLVVLLAWEHRAQSLKRWLLIVSTLLASLIVSSLIIFSAAVINQRDEISGTQAVSKSVNQLSFGILSLPVEHSDTASSAKNVKAKKSGYVSSSTDSRLSMSAQAISLWQTNPKTILVGVGIGGFGVSLHEKDGSYPVGSVVNNYYLEMLAETGIVGFGIFVIFLITTLYGLFVRRASLAFALLSALLIQLCFFSGNANIIHLWVILGASLGLLLSQPKKTARLVQ